ncbi:MAG: hypothetical protein AB1798_20835 [Spirochaetota bacterium]
MPRMTIDMSVEELAETITHLTDEERETLLLLLSPDGKELKKRKEEIEKGTVATVSHFDIFND